MSRSTSFYMPESSPVTSSHQHQHQQQQRPVPDASSYVGIHIPEIASSPQHSSLPYTRSDVHVLPQSSPYEHRPPSPRQQTSDTSVSRQPSLVRDAGQSRGDPYGAPYGGAQLRAYPGTRQPSPPPPPAVSSQPPSYTPSHMQQHQQQPLSRRGGLPYDVPDGTSATYGFGPSSSSRSDGGPRSISMANVPSSFSNYSDSAAQSSPLGSPNPTSMASPGTSVATSGPMSLSSPGAPGSRGGQMAQLGLHPRGGPASPSMSTFDTASGASSRTASGMMYSSPTLSASNPQLYPGDQSRHLTYSPSQYALASPSGPRQPQHQQPSSSAHVPPLPYQSQIPPPASSPRSTSLAPGYNPQGQPYVSSPSPTVNPYYPSSLAAGPSAPAAPASPSTLPYASGANLGYQGTSVHRPKKGFRRIRDARELRPVVNPQPVGRRADPSGGFISVRLSCHLDIFES
jgi:hypothetical protein